MSLTVSATATARPLGLFSPVRPRCARQCREALTRRHAQIAARADKQHRGGMQGDDRGIYSEYPVPEIVKAALPSWGKQ